MKIPAMLQERLNCRSSELLLSQCLGDLYMQFLTMDQKSKERDNTQASKSSIRCRSGSSRTSASSADEIMYSPSDVQSSFSGISSPVVRSAESLVDSDSELGAMPKEGFCSAEVNPVSYDNFTVSSAAWRAPLPTTLTSQHEASSARANVPAESCDSPESVPFESDSKGRRTWTGMNNHRVKLICSFGGRIIPRPHDGKLRYVGGETRIIAVNRHIRYSELMYKLTESHGIALTLKYQLPEDDLDALVSVSSEDDLQNMMEEHDRLEAVGGSARLRLFLFPAAEYDDYCLQNPGEDGFRSSQHYVDAVNGVPEKTFSKPFESFLTGSGRYVDDRFFPDSTLLRLKGPAVDVGAQEFIMSNMPHQLEAWQVSSPRAFTGPPTEFSSAPPSPPVASLQHHPAAPDSSLQYFQDRLNKVSVHCQLGPETRFQDFDKAGSGCSTSRRSEQHFPFADPQRGAGSPTSVVFELVSRGEHLHTGDSTSELIESPRRSSDVFNQHLEYSAISSHGHTLISDAQGPHEVVLPPQEPPQFVQQHQRMVLQKQQYEENVQRMEVVQHDTLSQCQSIQQPSVPTSYLHSDNSIHSGISRKMEQRSIYQENCIPGTFLQRSASSHSIGMGGQPTHPLSSVSTYHVVAVTPSVTVEPHNVHAQHHLRPNRTFSDSRIDKPCGRRVHYGDQNSKNLKISIPSSRFLGNTTSSAEWGVEHHQQHPILFAEAGHQEADNSSLHQFERYPVPRNQFPDSTASSLSPIYGESSVPPLEQTKTRCQMAVLDRAREMSIQNSIASNRQNSRPDYHIKVNQAAEQVTLYPGYEKRYSNCGGWIGTGTATQMEYNDKNTGKMFEGGKYNEGYYDLDRNYRRDGFDSPTLLNVGGISDFASPKSEWSMSSGTVPMTKYPASRALYAPTVSQGLITEDLQLYPSSTSLRLREPNQVSGIPAGFNVFVEHNSSDPALRKADSRLPTPVTCLRNNPSAIEGARDAVSLLNRAHNFGEPSTCGETSHLQNMYLEENHFTASSLSPEEVNGWMIGGTVNNSLCENTPDFLPNIFETVNGMQSTCENVSPCTLIHKDLSDSLEGQVCQVSSAAALSCQSTQLLSAPYPWNAFDPVANDNEQREPLNIPDLPIYDRSPVGSVNAAVSGKIFLDLKNEAGNLQSDLDKGTSAGQMSLTERLAEDMVCSVLGSSGNCAKYKGKSLNEEQTDENTEPHEQMVVREEDIRSTSKNMPPSPLMQDEKKSALCVEHFPGVTTEVRESVGGLAKENGSCEEIKNETSEQIEDKDSNEAGQKGMTCCAAEREAISHGLQIITNADLEEIRELGSGTFGTVYHGKWRGSDVAIKRIKASCFTGPLSEQERLISDFWKEACTLSQLHHPNVVAFYGVVPDGPDGTLATVTEYMVNGSLKQVLHKKDRTIDRRKRLLIAMDIAFGMEYLHSKNIVHFDLKCENLLVNMRDPHRPICKVGDFGLSKVKHHTLVSGGVRGTLPWMAPELLSGNNSKVTEKIDVFSFGIVMWELLTGEEPYANMHCGAIIGGIVNNTLRPSIPCWCDPAWRSLMERCWSADAADRPTFSEVASELRGIAATMNLK